MKNSNNQDYRTGWEAASKGMSKEQLMKSFSSEDFFKGYDDFFSLLCSSDRRYKVIAK